MHRNIMLSHGAKCIHGGSLEKFVPKMEIFQWKSFFVERIMRRDNSGREVLLRCPHHRRRVMRRMKHKKGERKNLRQGLCENFIMK